MSREEQTQLIQQVADKVGGTVRDDYSGRGMFGDECYGIDCDDRDACIMAAAKAGLPRPKTDNMGLGWIVYWPEITK